MAVIIYQEHKDQILKIKYQAAFVLINTISANLAITLPSAQPLNLWVAWNSLSFSCWAAA